MIRERPSLFNGPMVRAILDGRKTQTRRVIKPQPEIVIGHNAFTEQRKDGWIAASKCPYGTLGDRLWVRETCQAVENEEGVDGVLYDADGEFRVIENTQDASDRWCDLFAYGKVCGKRVPSIHMPRWASRITLDITDVRVERLQDITEADAIAEGILMIPKSVFGPNEKTGRPPLGPTPRMQFATYWDSVNGPKSWQANPWVWVVSFTNQGVT